MVHFDHGGKHFHVIDTPGYPDFIGQTIGAMRGVDTAAIVINAQSGIEVNTRRVFDEAKQGRPGPDHRHQQDGRRQHRLPRAGGEHPGAVRQGAACC